MNYKFGYHAGRLLRFLGESFWQGVLDGAGFWEMCECPNAQERLVEPSRASYEPLNTDENPYRPPSAR